MAAEESLLEVLMRTDGILARITLVFHESARRLQANLNQDPVMLTRAATLFKHYGHDFHAHRLEEGYIFPVVKQAGGPAGALVDVLITQHKRGHLLIDYLAQAIQASGPMAWCKPPDWVMFLDQFEQMMDHHAAREATVILPALLRVSDADTLGALGEKFAAAEREFFGKGSYQALREIGEIEQAYDLSDISPLGQQFPF